MSKLKDLIAQKEALEQQIAEVQQTELAEAISQVKAIVDEFDLTPDQVFPKGKAGAKGTEKAKAPAKYKDPVSGKTWTGHGMQPKWLVGKDRSEFSIS